MTASNGSAGIVVVSPCIHSEEEKNQDRAAWYPRNAVAAVADGVTQSPCSSDAAQMAVDFAPVLLHHNNCNSTWLVLRDMLLTRRIEREGFDPELNDEYTSEMRSFMTQLSRKKMATSFQTTLVACSLIAKVDHVTARFAWIGDSAFFVFNRAGDLLLSNRRRTPNPLNLPVTGYEFGPGAALICQRIGTAEDDPHLALHCGISPENHTQWQLVKPIYKVKVRQNDQQSPQDGYDHVLDEQHLLVPNFCLQPLGHDAISDLFYLAQSPSVRWQGPPRVILAEKGQATHVLPDHIQADKQQCITEVIPRDSHVMLCSDGFYSAFEHIEELWKWFVENELHLRDPTQHHHAMDQIHQTLDDTGGDDDVSLVWIDCHNLTQTCEVEDE